MRFRVSRWGALLACMLMASGVAALGQRAAANASPSQTGDHKTSAPQQNKDDGGLSVEPAELPSTYPHGAYLVTLQARGNYVPVLQWSVQSGGLPPGITLDDSGTLRGEAERAGEYEFVLLVKDGSKPQQAVQKAYTIKVVEGVLVTWKTPAHVAGSRIEGSIEISNTTADDMDLTYDVKAVAENGRATEIGYQRFPLKKGTVGMALPFGETLPHGSYMVYVNVSGEIAKQNAIYKQQMQTSAALQVIPGP